MTSHARENLHFSNLKIRTVSAVQHVRKMRGGAQSQLMRCSDGELYVVKFTNNPQHLRVLANEMFASLLARHLGLAVAEGVIVTVDASLVRASEMTIQLQRTTIPCQSGLQFGSLHVESARGAVFDYFPTNLFDQVRNRQQFWGMLAFDKWTCNADMRQAAFWKVSRKRLYNATFIDQGYCFNGGDWLLKDNVQRGIYAHNEVYTDVRNWESFEPWLSGIESMEKGVVQCLAGAIPLGWRGDDKRALKCLALLLHERRNEVRGAINSFRLSTRRPFPNWEGDEVISRDGSAG